MGRQAFRIIWMIGFICGIRGHAVSQVQTDTLVLTFREYLDNLINFHPIAKQAELRLDLGAAELLSAKGNLDPEIKADWNQKNFDGKLYYRQYRGKLIFPTILGIDVVGGYENTQGVFLNPENQTDDFGLWNIGVEVNVLQGLIVNERRIALEQAEVFQDLAKNERQIMLNDLMYAAISAYFDWQQYYWSQAVLQENIEIANTYFESTKQSFEGGEKTAMDTLEAFILYQDAISILQKNEIGLIKARQNVENYLWFESLPIMLQDQTVPEDTKNALFLGEVDFDSSNLSAHPEILAAVNKLSYLEIEQKLKREKLKPKLKLKFNPLLSTSDNNIGPNYTTSDYKWGLDFSMPLLFRSERADVQRGEIKLMESSLSIQNKRNELQNKIESSLLQQAVIRQNLNLTEQNVENYKRLLDGESEKFKFGESSVFLLNKRQEKYIDGQLKLIDMEIDLQFELLNYLYFSNRLMVN